MSVSRIADRRAAGLRIGDLVEVKSVDEILATLDERGRLEALDRAEHLWLEQRMEAMVEPAEQAT
jgi:hypothetical protein